MSGETPGEKTFAPTERRKSEAAKKGDVLRSREAANAAAMAAAALALGAAGPWLYDGVLRTARLGFRFDRQSLDDFTPGAMIADSAVAVLPAVMVIGLIVAAAVIVSQLALGEGRFVPGNAAFKPARLNPLTGLKRMFGTQGLIELGKGLAKLGLLGSMAWWWAEGEVAALLGMGAAGIETQLGLASTAASSLFLALLAGLIVIAMLDYPLQQFQRGKRLKMSLQDLREENKQSEGSPEVRAARRQRQRDLARGGVAKAMREAQFVVTNPMHFAVALTYDPARAPAPLVLAKGRGETALAMREIAAEQGLPVLEYPSLARALYYSARKGEMVKAELYVALAALVAFVMALKRGEHPRRPEVNVPESLRFDADGRPESITA